MLLILIILPDYIYAHNDTQLIIRTSVVFDDDDKCVEWNRLKRKIEEGLVPAEERVAQKLKSQIADATTPNSLLAEFRRYFELIKRDGLKRALRGEREALLSAYGDLTGNSKGEKESKLQ